MRLRFIFQSAIVFSSLDVAALAHQGRAALRESFNEVECLIFHDEGGYGHAPELETAALATVVTDRSGIVRNLHLVGRPAVADLTILFTASTDYTGAVPNASGTYGYSYPNDPVNQNPNVPAISPG